MRACLERFAQARVLVLFLSPLVPLGWWTLAFGGHAPAAGEPALGGDAYGILYADLGRGEDDPLFLPDFEVDLEDVRTGRRVDRVRSDLSGRFRFHRQTPGEYRACWRGEGWTSGCHPENLSFGEGTEFIGLVPVRPGTGPDGQRAGVVTGILRLADGGTGVLVDPFFGVEEVPQVELAGRKVRVNASGRFVVAGVTPDGLAIEARVGKDRIAPPLVAKALDLSGWTPVDLVSPNRSPRVPSLTVLRDGIAAASAPPGTTLEVRAQAMDADADLVEYRWATSSGELSENRGPNVRWTLPSYPGTFALYVLAADGRGGFSRGRVDVTAGAAPGTACKPIPCEGCPKWDGYSKSIFLTYSGQGAQEQAAAYYKAVDPLGHRQTLGGWWEVNGFDKQTGQGGVRASYLNHNDLGFGRDMHCRANGQDVACYVTNYGCGDQSPANADLAFKANVADRKATVTMEFSALEGQMPPNPRIVKFFVYDGGVAASKRIEGADLDEYGVKYVPQLCLNCHGGSYQPENPLSPTSQEVNMGSSFREFDLPSFRYTEGRTFEKLKDPELAAFKSLNEMASKTEPNEPIRDLISSWYAHGGLWPNVDWAPPLWQDPANPKKKELYQKVVATSCRTCHVAFRSKGEKKIDWSTYTSFQKSYGYIKLFVCGTGKSMPHAKVTYKNFWQSKKPQQPEVLAQFSAEDWGSFGQCTGEPIPCDPSQEK